MAPVASRSCSSASRWTSRGHRPLAKRHGSAGARSVGGMGGRVEAPHSNDQVAAERLDLGLRVAGLAEDLVGVLAERGRLALDAGAAVGELEAGADQAHGAVARVDRLQDVAGLQLRVLDDLVDLPDARA